MNISKANTEVTITAQAWKWMALHGYACLGLRHPQASEGRAADELRPLLRSIGRMLQDCGLLTPQEVAATERDFEQGERQ